MKINISINILLILLVLYNCKKAEDANTSQSENFSNSDSLSTKINSLSEEKKDSLFQEISSVVEGKKDSTVLDKEFYRIKLKKISKGAEYEAIEDEVASHISDYDLKDFDGFIIKKDQILKITDNYALIILSLGNGNYEKTVLSIDKNGNIIEKILIEAGVGNVHWAYTRTFKYDSIKNKFIITDEYLEDAFEDKVKELLWQIEILIQLENDGKFKVSSNKLKINHL